MNVLADMGKLLLIVVSIVGVAFFASIETALLSTSGTSLSGLKERFPRKAKFFSIWEERPHYLLAAIVTGTNAFFMSAGVLATSLSMNLAKVHGLAGMMAVLLPLIVTALVLFFGEILPKIYGRKNPEKVCGFGIKPLALFAKPIAPATSALIKISETILRAFGFYGVKEAVFLNKEELKIILNAEEGLSSELSKRDRTILTNILSFGERRIKEVMIPRSETFAINYNSGLAEIVSEAIASRYSRIPVYKNTLDNIIGIIYAKDLVVARGGSPLYILDDLLMPVYFIPESAPVSRVLREMKSGRHHIAVVVDEYGITSGIVTVEDLVEEIVGEIYDEYDIREKKIIELPDGWLIRGGESVASVNAELGIGLPQSEAYFTLAGWVLFLFGKIPQPGEKTRWKNIGVEVMESDKRRVIGVKISKERQ
jgi:putative hemolysin